MRRRYYYSLPPWLRHCRDVAFQIIVPLTVFQAIRTLILPTTFDVVLLSVFVLLAVALYLEWI